MMIGLSVGNCNGRDSKRKSRGWMSWLSEESYHPLSRVYQEAVET